MKTSLPISASSITTKAPDKIADVPPSLRVLVIGGTGFIGRLLVTELLRRGHQVALLHRRPKHCFSKRVGNIVADRNDPVEVKRALGSLKFDAVYDNVYDWERGTNSLQIEATARIFEGHVSRYIFMSSVSAYGDGLNHHEGDPLAPDDHPSSYVRNKAMSERSLFRMHQRTGFPVVTLRPPYIYGPDNPFYREAFFWDRLRANRPVILPSDGHRLMQFVFVHDLAEVAVRVLEQRNAVGHAFNTSNAKAITQNDFLKEVARAAGFKEAHVVSIPRDKIHAWGGQAIGQRQYFGYWLDMPAITQVITKAQRMLSFRPTDMQTGLKLTYKSYLKKRGFPKPDFAFEDELIERSSKALGRAV